jgi:FkbM family methyltransferase
VHAATIRGYRGSLRLWGLATRIAPLPPIATIEVGGRPLPVELGDHIGPYVYYGVYERWELEAMSRLVRPGGSCIDVGANIGLYTLAMQVLAGQDGTVIAFEPEPTLSARLHTVLQPDLARTVVVPSALGSSAGTAILHVFPWHVGLATLRAQDVTGTRRVEVPVVALDDVEVVSRLGEIDFLKVDVESFEAEVLTGAQELLSSGRLRAALIEVSAEQPRVAAQLGGLSPEYELFRVTQRRRYLRYRAALERLTPSQLANTTDQLNLLMCRRDVVGAVQHLIQ